MSGKSHPAVLVPGQNMQYDQARDLLDNGDESAHETLAARPDTPQEMLYYLAEHGALETRAAVARNMATPHQANLLLSEDEEAAVRAELARKIVRILPGLEDDQLTQIREATIAIMEKLAQDQAPLVRQRLAEELQASEHVPPSVVKSLAGDELEEIACPVLQYSPLLRDEDLRELIAAGLSAGSLGAVAQRPAVSEEISDAITTTLDIPAIAALLTNPDARIREDTMNTILEQAKDTSMLHGPLVHRSGLSDRVMERLAEFIARPLIEILTTKHALPEAMKSKLLAAAKGAGGPEARADREEQEKLALFAQSMKERDAITDDAVLTAVASGKRKLAMHYLAAEAGLDYDVVARIIATREPKAMVALCHRAGLSMRTAYLLQSQLAMVTPDKLIAAREGRYYPLPETDMSDVLAVFGI